MDYELEKFDRIQVIKTANEKYDLESNAYISFSGGKDSTILHYLIDEALPNNNIPRVYVDTGIEYLDIKKFVTELASKDDRFLILKPSKPIKQTLEENGYPFKSKEHSLMVSVYQHSGKGKTVRRYLEEEGNKLVTCPKILRYQFEDDFKLKISNKCCYKLKKEPFAKYQKENGKTITITGMRREEGGLRKSIKGCILTDKDGKIIKFHPLLVVGEEWENKYVKEKGIKLCRLYYPPFNFERTGCKGCPYSLNLQKQLEIMSKYIPNEKEQCEIIWKPIYEEYRRIRYRLKENIKHENKN